MTTNATTPKTTQFRVRPSNTFSGYTCTNCNMRVQDIPRICPTCALVVDNYPEPTATATTMNSEAAISNEAR